jgi:hypothetical protein
MSDDPGRDAKMKIPQRLVLKVLEGDLKMLDKQIRMLAELTQNAPVLRRTTDLTQTEIEIVAMPRQRVQEFVEQMKLELYLVRRGLGALAAPGTHVWPGFEIVAEDQEIA